MGEKSKAALCEALRKCTDEAALLPLLTRLLHVFCLDNARHKRCDPVNVLHFIFGSVAILRLHQCIHKPKSSLFLG